MKATPLIINWHDSNTPVYSCDWEKGPRQRLATGGGDGNVRLWTLESDGEDRKVEYLCSLVKHTQAVNVVRWAPKGELLASASDDGNVILWVPSESHNIAPVFGGDDLEEKETWRAKNMCRSSGAEIYDLAWSPDSVYFIIGSMDNVARIYNAQSGQLVRQIAEHQHYVQGVAWDPLNEYIATQSSDRSVHVYTLRTKDGQFTLDSREDPKRIANNLKMDLPGRRFSSQSPAPEIGFRTQLSIESNGGPLPPTGPSCPGTPTSMVALPMNPPSVTSHSRRSSIGPSSPAPSMRRSVSPAPAMPLPAVMPMEASPKPYMGHGMKNANIYANETMKSFFRRLTFTPDGSLLLTPAGQYQSQFKSSEDGAKPMYEVINTVYIYTRGGINRPPVAHLPGHKKPSVAVRCSPVLYTARTSSPKTEHITIDTSSAEDAMVALPEPVVAKSSNHIMEPPPPIPQISEPLGSAASPAPNTLEVEANASTQGPTMAFTLPYRIVYAVATEDSVLLYDTQQHTPLCIVSNLHCATFTDLSWSNDGRTLLMASSDGFCSSLTFDPGELGTLFSGEVPTARHPVVNIAPSNSPHLATPSASVTPLASKHRRTPSNPIASASPQTIPLPSFRPTSPTRSNSTSSVATQASYATPALGTVISNPTIIAGTLPGLAAAGVGGFASSTPPQTPRSSASSVVGKREIGDIEVSEGSDGNEGREKKKRRIAPTIVEQPRT